MRNPLAAACRHTRGRMLVTWRPHQGRRWLAAALLFFLGIQASGCASLERHSGVGKAAPERSSKAWPDDGPEAQLFSSPMTVLFRGAHPRHAVIMLAGIYNDHQYFLPWRDSFTRDEVLLLGWQRAHHVQRLDDSARLLAGELLSLQEQGIRKVTLIAHSIGGLVAKGALDHLTREQLYYRFDDLELHAFGTPWGGFPGADLAHGNPVGHLLSYLAGNPAWLDLGTQSSYLTGLAQAMPPNGRFFNYVLDQDEVAKPSNENAGHRYQNLLRHAAASLQVSGTDHNAYVQHSIERLMQLAWQDSLSRTAMEKVENQAGGAAATSSGASE